MRKSRVGKEILLTTVSAMKTLNVIEVHERKILVTGASGYIGGRLVRKLVVTDSHIRVMVRDKRKISDQSWINNVEVSIADAKDSQATEAALEGIHTAFYLLHSLTMGSDFKNLEAINARNFIRAAEKAGVKQIVYLGGIANDKQISEHMKSRVNTGLILSEGSVPVLEIRAGIIIGTGSASFEMLRHLVHRLPIMTTPRWVKNRTQPVAISDVIFYLSQASTLKTSVDGVFDIGGPDVLSYLDLIQKFAKISGAPKRWIINLPFPSLGVSSFLLGLLTTLPTALARPLVGSLVSNVVVDQKKSINSIINPPPNGLLGVEEAIELALGKISPREVEPKPSALALQLTPWAKAPSDPAWVG